MIRKLCSSALVVAGIGAATAAGVAVGETIQVGNLILTADASFKPTTLPKNEMAPISLSVEAHVTTQDGAIPPIAESVVIDFDKERDSSHQGRRHLRSEEAPEHDHEPGEEEVQGRDRR